VSIVDDYTEIGRRLRYLDHRTIPPEPVKSAPPPEVKPDWDPADYSAWDDGDTCPSCGIGTMGTVGAGALRSRLVCDVCGWIKP
jgi:hypothetical protein